MVHRSRNQDHPTRVVLELVVASVSVDIFHSQDPTVLTYLAQRIRPECVHVVTSRDPRDARDWWTELRYATNRRRPP